MIHIIDRQTEQILDVMVNQSDQKIYWDTKMTEAIEDNVLIFEFRMLADSPAAKHLIPKNKLTAQDQDGFHRLFIIDTVEMSHDANGKVLFVSALGDHIELANDEPIPPQTLAGQTAETAVQFVLANTRYVPGQIDFAGSRTITFDTYTNPLAALQKIASVFDLELRFRVTVNPDGTITRIVDLLKPDEVFDGKEIVFGKDMTGIRRKENTENICTRLVGIGPADEDGNLVTFASVNGGKIYVEDEEAFQRWNNAGRHIWGIFEYQPEDGTEVTPQQLLDATKKEMEKRKNSAVEWEVQAAALEQVIGLEHERVRAGMNVRIKDEAFDPPIYLEARVLETEMPELDDPNGNFSYTFGNYREVKVVVPAEVKAIQKILFHNSGGWSAAKVKADIAQQIANEAKADVEAANARIDNLIAVDITALHAEIENLEAIKANVEDLFSINAQIENLRAEKANITDLEATNARIDNLVANDLTAINAEITNLKAGKANITDLNATNARVGALEADVGSINTLLAGNLGAENFRAGAIYAGSGVIAQGAIGDAEISNLNASKINAGILNTALVTIQGANGRLKMSGNRLQVFANKTDGSLYERVSLGDVNGDGSVYGLRVRGADGQTVLFDENGVKREGITDGSITNEKIADDANISGTKLDIASVVTEINEGTTTIQSSKIFYNGKTLDIQLGTMQTTINNQGQTITNHETRITATEQGLATKVSVSQYQQDQAALSSQLSQMSTQIQQQANQIALKADAANVYTKSQIDGQFTTVNTQISNLSAQLTVQAGQIATKVSRTELQTAIDGIQVGGRNLARQTDFSVLPSSWQFRGNYNGVIDTSNTYQGHNSIKITTNGAGIDGTNDFVVWLRGVLPAVNDNYTISFYAKAQTGGGKVFARWGANGSSNRVITGQSLTTNWQKFVINLTISSVTTGDGAVVMHFTTDDIINIALFKIEKGNKATDWTPAPEDVQGQIDGLGSRLSTAETSITQLANQIQLKANQTTVDTLANRISSAESTINLLSDEIDLKVNKDGVISAINQTAEQIKIQASKVDLSGYVTFTNLSTPGQTTIDGGNLKTGSVTTDKIAAKAITADKLNVTSLDAISANLGTVTAGTIRGVNIYGSTIEGTVLKSSDTPSWDDPNYTTKASIQSGWLEFWDKSLGAELKLEVSGLGITLRGSANGWDFAPPDYRPDSSTYTEIHNGSIHVVSPNGNANFFINTRKLGIGWLGSFSLGFEVTTSLSNTTVKIGNCTLKSEWDNPDLTLSGSLNLSDSAKQLVLTESDNRNKQWHIEVNNGALNFVETDIATRLTLYPGGGLETRDDIIFSVGLGRVVADSSATYIQNNTEIRATKYKSTTYVPVRASSFPTGSLAEYKEDIHPWQESALEKIRSATIYEYYLKSELEQGIYRKRQGLVIGEGYNTPIGVIDGDGVEQYLMNAWSWKAIQELDNEQQSLKDRIAWLEIENQYLKQKIQQLEAMVS